MRKTLLYALCAAMALICGCTETPDIGVIGGADGPTKVYVRDTPSLDYEKDDIKIARIDGALWYETDEESNAFQRCGVFDGKLEKTANKWEIPQNDGECNFGECEGYQFGATENTLEVFIDDEWKSFAKITTETDILGYKYCCELEGEMPNSEHELELLVLSNEKNISFSDAVYKLTGADMSKMKDIYVIPLNSD